MTNTSYNINSLQQFLNISNLGFCRSLVSYTLLDRFGQFRLLFRVNVASQDLFATLFFLFMWSLRTIRGGIFFSYSIFPSLIVTLLMQVQNCYTCLLGHMNIIFAVLSFVLLLYHLLSRSLHSISVLLSFFVFFTLMFISSCPAEPQNK